MAKAKSIKSVAKEAKQRLKNRFWQDYRDEEKQSYEKAKDGGVSASLVSEYYQSKLTHDIYGTKTCDEQFYQKVKHMLDLYGKPANALDLLMDKDFFHSLGYCQRECYLFRLSDDYQKAMCRYSKELPIENLKMNIGN